MAPSITPLVTQNVGTNPGIRQYFYTNNSDYLLDYKQYYVNLELANLLDQASWTELYSFRNAYKAKDLSPKSLRQVLDKIKDDSHTFDLAYRLNTLMQDNGKAFIYVDESGY